MFTRNNSMHPRKSIMFSSTGGIVYRAARDTCTEAGSERGGSVHHVAVSSGGDGPCRSLGELLQSERVAPTTGIEFLLPGGGKDLVHIVRRSRAYRRLGAGRQRQQEQRQQEATAAQAGARAAAAA